MKISTHLLQLAQAASVQFTNMGILVDKVDIHENSFTFSGPGMYEAEFTFEEGNNPFVEIHYCQTRNSKRWNVGRSTGWGETGRVLSLVKAMLDMGAELGLNEYQKR